MAKYRIEHVIVDAVAFFRNVQLQEIAENVHSLQAVVNEIRDKATRQRLAVLPYDLTMKEPSTESIRFVSDFAKKTGDYQSLSAVDVRVVALAYQLTKEYVGTDHLKAEPEKKVTYTSTKKNLESVKDIAGFYYPVKKNDECGDTEVQGKGPVGDVVLQLSGLEENTAGDGGGDGKGCEDRTHHDATGSEELVMEERVADVNNEMEEARGDGGTGENREVGVANPDTQIEVAIEKADDMEVEEDRQNVEDEVVEEAEVEGDRGEEDGLEVDQEDDDDDVGWITPQNISQVRQQMGGGDEASLEGVKVACMTTDFAMQNVLIQIGIPVLSVNGMLIKQAKSFVFRCHDCFKVTHDMTKVFCPKCGNRSLDKVTMTVDEDGTQRFHLSRRRPANARGLRYAMPKPKGGKHASNPVLCADQRQPQNRVSRKAQMRTNVFDPNYEAMNSPFAAHDVTSRSAQLGIRQAGSQGSASRRNPNENRRQNKKGKRR